MLLEGLVTQLGPVLGAERLVRFVNGVAVTEYAGMNLR